MTLKKYNSIDIETDGLDIDDKINFIGIHTFDNDEDIGDYIIIDANNDKTEDFLPILKELCNTKYINI